MRVAIATLSPGSGSLAASENLTVSLIGPPSLDKFQRISQFNSRERDYLDFSKNLSKNPQNGRRARTQESVKISEGIQKSVGRESSRAHIEVLKGRQSFSNPFGILKWARGDSRPTGMGSLPLFEAAASRNGNPYLIGMGVADRHSFPITGN